MATTDLTAPLPPAAAAALLRLERALITTDHPGMTAADVAAHEKASHVRQYRRAA